MSDFFDIDLNRLEWEWARQPGLYHKYATEAADARQKYERAKANLKVVEAEKDKEIRSDPTAFGLEKVTEPAVAKAIVLCRKYREAVQEEIDCGHAVDIAEAACKTLDHKKYALQDEVRLRLSDYYSEPRVKNDEGNDRMRQAKADDMFTPKGRKK